MMKKAKKSDGETGLRCTERVIEVTRSTLERAYRDWEIAARMPSSDMIQRKEMCALPADLAAKMYVDTLLRYLDIDA